MSGPGLYSRVPQLIPKLPAVTLDTLKTRTDALSAVLAAHLADNHDDCSLDDVTAALSSLLSGIDHAVFRRKL